MRSSSSLSRTTLEMGALSLALVAVLIGVTVAACSSDQGQPGPGPGTSSGTVVPDSGTDDPDGSGAGDGSTPGAKKKVAEVGCVVDTDCEKGVCFSGNAQAFCTFACTAANATTICVAPLTGSCNNKGYCKRD